MNDDELHELKMRMGESVMDVQDAWNTDIAEALNDVREATLRLAVLLHEQDVPRPMIAGMIGGAMFEAALDA